MLNECHIQGRFVRDAELRRTKSGIAVVNFTLGVDRDYLDKEGKKITDWIDFVAWREIGEELAQTGKKGRLIVVDGKIQSKTWTTQSGSKRSGVEINVTGYHFSDGMGGPGRVDTGDTPFTYSDDESPL